MKAKEKELFKQLCSFKAERFDGTLLAAATPAVLGQLFFNRMQAVACGTLEKHGLSDRVNREFRNALKDARRQSREKNDSFFRCLADLENVLSGCGVPYAMLKGAYLCRQYPAGYRTANDVDLLVRPADVTAVGKALAAAGFRQGYIRGGRFVPASRREIVESKMTRGETVPYLRETDLPGMPFLEADINFSLDYKPGDTALLEEMLTHTAAVGEAGKRVRTLREDDFFVHLCAHLYKEAAALPWVRMKRDMTLYKYSDIYLLLNDASKEYVDHLFARAKALGMEKVCAFAVCQTAALFAFENGYAVQTAEAALKSDPAFLHTVIDPQEGKRYLYTEKDIAARFFADDRMRLLKEEKTV